MSTDPITASPLDTAETSFRLLTTGPGALSLNCTTLAPALPRGEVNLAELRMLLTSRHVSDETRDAVWRELVTRARVRKGAWTVAAVGMAMPALRMIAATLTGTFPTKTRRTSTPRSWPATCVPCAAWTWTPPMYGPGCARRAGARASVPYGTSSRRPIGNRRPSPLPVSVLSPALSWCWPTRWPSACSASRTPN